MKFLPQDYQAPKNSNKYMKLQDGDNRIRILTAPVMGWEDWLDNKPIRYRLDQKPAKSNDPKKPIRHFWAFIVWNYIEEKIQILHLTQATIRNNIEALCKDEDWGEPFFYDIKITRKGEGVETEYMVNPSPHKELPPKVKEQFLENPCYLDALFDGGDPFSSEYENYSTPGVFDKRSSPASTTISDDQRKEIEDVLEKCPKEYKQKTLEHLKKHDSTINTLADIPLNMFERVKNAAFKKMMENPLGVS